LSWYRQWTGGLQKKLDSLLKVPSRLLDRIALAGNVKVRAKGNIAVSFTLDQRCDMLDVLHGQTFVAVLLYMLT
jgi:hypothetical protein